MKKRILSILLCLTMCLSLLPTTALAAEDDDDAVTFTATGGTDGFDGESYGNLFDGQTTTKWCVMTSGSWTGAYVCFEASEPIYVSGYTMTTGDDTKTNPGRNPTSWTLYGSTEETSEWTEDDIIDK